VLRYRAIRSLLVEDVAGLRLGSPDDPPDESPPGGSAEPAEALEAARLEDEEQALRHAERRALLVVGLDWLALAVLFVLRDTAAPFLPFDPTVDTVFTLGILAVAIHSGFRLGQLEKYRAILRVHHDLR
jgi:hypothetical protein